MPAWFVALQFHPFSVLVSALYCIMTISQHVKGLERTKIWSCVPTEPETEIYYAGDGQQQST
jgi:hypothetical protein